MLCIIWKAGVNSRLWSIDPWRFQQNPHRQCSISLNCQPSQVLSQTFTFSRFSSLWWREDSHILPGIPTPPQESFFSLEKISCGKKMMGKRCPLEYQCSEDFMHTVWIIHKISSWCNWPRAFLSLRHPNLPPGRRDPDGMEDEKHTVRPFQSKPPVWTKHSFG